MTAPLVPQRRSALRFRVLLLVGVGVLAPTMLLAAVAWSRLGDLDERLLRDRQAAAEAAAAALDGELTADLEALQRIASSLSLESDHRHPEREAELLRRAYLGFRFVGGVFVLDGDGKLRMEEPHRERPSAPPADLPELQEVLATGRPAISGLVPEGAGWRVYAMVAVMGWRGDVAGVVGGLIEPGQLRQAGRLRALVRSGGTADLVDGDGTVIASTDRDRLHAGGTCRPVLASQIRLHAADSRRCAACHRTEPASGGAGQPGVLTVAPLSAARWGVTMVEPADAVLASAGSLPRSLPALLVGVLVMAAGFAWGAARSVTRPVEQLTAEAEKISGGRLDEPIPDMGRDEVGRLARSLDRMRASLAGSMAQVERANAALEARVLERTRELHRALEALREREAQRARLLRTVITAQEDERKRVARELHDETTQELAVLVMGLETALAALRGGGAPPRLDEVKALAVHVLEGIHRLILDLRPAVLDDLGLYSAVRWYAERQLGERGVAVRCELGPPPPERLPPEVEIALFRICQEALNNVVRHAGAESVLVQLEAAGGELRIEIEDDGKGFEPGGAAPDDRPHWGLVGIRERAELLGGTARIDSAPGQGTRVEIRLPLPEGAPRTATAAPAATPAPTSTSAPTSTATPTATEPGTIDSAGGAGDNRPRGEGR